MCYTFLCYAKKAKMAHEGHGRQEGVERPDGIAGAFHGINKALGVGRMGEIISSPLWAFLIV